MTTADYDLDGRPRDLRGRQALHQFRSTTLMRAVPGLYEQFRAIPDQFWNEDDEGDRKMAVVACPCGQEPTVEMDKFQACVCERVFWFAGRDVRVANSPAGAVVSAPPDPEEEDDGEDR